MNILKFIYSNIRNRKMHALLSVFIIAVVTTIFFFSQMMVWGMQKGVEIGVNRLGADIIVLPRKMGSTVETMLFSPEPMNVYFPEIIMEQIAEIPGIARYSPQFFGQTLNEDCCSLGRAYRLVGFDQATDFVLDAWMEDNLQSPLADDEIIVGADIPSFLGSRAVILSGIFSVAGQLKPTGSKSLDNTIFMPLDQVRELAGNSPYLTNVFNEGYMAVDLLSAVLIKVENGSNIYNIAQSISSIPGLQAIVMSNLALQAKSNILITVKILLVMFAFLWILSIIAIVNHFLAEVWRRKREIGIIRAVGGSPWAVQLLFIMEAEALSLLGALIGLPFGYLLLKGEVRWLLTDSLIAFTPPTLLIILFYAGISILLALGTGLLGVVYPAFVASHIDPALAISRGELE
jgi:putative ABC transport system permease protein